MAAEVLDRPVQTFLPTRDGGRDGAFLGVWRPGRGEATCKSTIQCKFSTQVDARLSLSKLNVELAKAADLVRQGLAEDYVILTNAGVTGVSEARICAAFEAVGVKHCQVFDGDWILRQLHERPRLRMMAPRVYGLLSLSEIIVAPAYDQARAILASMGGDLGAFVSTGAHRQAVDALAEHGFVLLVGNAAAGKSTIAATLALGALDAGCTGAVRISSPDQLRLWRPQERQFLWVDDAFGPTQYEAARVQRWNAELPALRAAVRDGARAVFTTRNYIWERARLQLKLNALPLMRESQVVIDVEDLTPEERAQILFNHVRSGGLPQAMRTRLKPHLPRLAAKTSLTPEIARRLGDPFITARLSLTTAALDDFVDHPVEFLKEVITNLSDAGRAALALIFMHPASGLPSPIPSSDALRTVTRLTGVDAAEIAQELEAMNDSLTLLTPGTASDLWVFRHPTIGDAFADLVAESPELVELYMAGARPDRLMVEVTCGRDAAGAKVRVPQRLYGQLISRLAPQRLGSVMKSFLASRCDAAFLTAFVAAKPEVLELSPGMSLADDTSLKVLAALGRAACLPPEVREKLAALIDDCTIDGMDPSVFVSDDVRSLVSEDDIQDLESRFRAKWIDNLSDTVWHWRHDYRSLDPLGMAESFRDTLARLEEVFGAPDNVQDFVAAYRDLDEWVEELEASTAARPRTPTTWPSSAPPPAGSLGIFSDVDA